MFSFLRSLFGRDNDFELIDGLPVPTKGIRLCGKAIQDSAAYIETAKKEAHRLVEMCGCKAGSRVLDIGCGHGRLATGLLSVVPEMEYHGLDVSPEAINWCKRRFRNWKQCSFQHVNVQNERYHTEGSSLKDGYQFPVAAANWDIIFLFSVFSHMEENEMCIYLKDFVRLLRPNGRVVFTTFVEENVPPFSVNPEGYIFEQCSGPLHIVRYEKNHIFKLVEDCGLKVLHFGHRTELDQQSVLILGSR